MRKMARMLSRVMMKPTRAFELMPAFLRMSPRKTGT